MAIRARLARHGWFVAIALTYFYAFPYFPRVQSANELPRVYLIKAIADDHTFAIDDGVARYGSTADVSPSGGHQYSNKAPGSSLLALPAYVAAEAVAGEPGLGASMWIARVFGGIVPALLFLLLVYRFLARWVPDPAIRQLVCLAYGLGSMAMTYSILFYSHQLATACVFAAWVFGLDAAERKRGPWAFALAGGFAGCAPLVDYQAVFAAVPILVHLVAKVIAARWTLVEIARGLGLALAGAAAPIAGLLAYHAACFGSPWRTGYDASTTFAHHHQQGFLGITTLRWEAFVGSTVKLDNGLVALAPWFLLAVPGLFVLARGLHHPQVEARPLPRADRARAMIELGAGAVLVTAAITLGVFTEHAMLRTTVIAFLLVVGAALATVGALRIWPARKPDVGTTGVVIAVIAIYLAFISSITFWRGGWGVGPRYITVMLPFLLPPIAVMLAALQRWNRLAAGAAAGTIVVGIAIYTLSSVTFPYWLDTVKHPLVDITFRMLASDLVAPNVLGALGVPGVWSIVPIILVVAAMAGFAIHRVTGWGGLGVAVAVAAGVIGGYQLVPHGGAQADKAFAYVRKVVDAR